MSSHPLESLSALLDDELPAAERRGVEAHVAACPSCARHLRELAAVDALARGLPPAGAPDGYLETLPGRVRRRIRADRPASARLPWVWPLAAGLALAVLAPIVLRQQRSPDGPPPDRPDVAMERPAAPLTTVAPVPGPPATAGAGKVARPQASLRATRPEAAPAAKTRDAFAAPPPAAAHANESDQGAARASGGVVGGIVEAPPAAAPAAEQEAPAAAGRRKEERAEGADALAERIDAPSSSLKKADAVRQAAAERKRMGDAEKAFQDNASLPASTAEEARRAREAWRRFVSLHAAGRHADEGRVRFIEAAVAVFGLTGDEEDRTIAEREARAYLANPDAPQASRVRDALRRLDRER